MAEYIEREAAIESIMSEPTDAHYPSWYADKIKEIPAADVAPVRRWIPVAERLPDIGIEVLIYSEDDGICMDYYGGDSFGYYDVTHWMPLPEPPKEG